VYLIIGIDLQISGYDIVNLSRSDLLAPTQQTALSEVETSVETSSSDPDDGKFFFKPFGHHHGQSYLHRPEGHSQVSKQSSNE